MQTSATPVSTPQSVQDAVAGLDVMRWSGVVLEEEQVANMKYS